MGKVFKESLKLQLYITLAFLPLVSAARLTRAWNDNYLEPCHCSQKIEDAIPQIFSNRRSESQTADFNKILSKLILSFVNDESIPAAEKGIFWTVYELGSQDIVNALIAAKEKGLRVEVLTDGKSILENPLGEEDESRSFQRQLLVESYRRLRAAHVPVYYSHPDWEPVGTLYPRIMHEKIRIFARKIRSRWKPLFAYVSTHNDTYSEIQGDPRDDIGLERIRQGNLQTAELIEGSQGNVQLSFILRNEELLKELWDNYQEQVAVYGQGRGGIRDLPAREPIELELADSSRIFMAMTFGRRTSWNPNQRQADFLKALAEDNSLDSTKVRLTQFVFTYGKVEDALKLLAQNEEKPIEAIVDARAAFEPYTQARTMAGLFSVTDYRPGNYLDYPWKKALRKNLIVKTYSHKNDRLHLKNSYIKYRKGREASRYRIYTGSLNLSSNGSANKEVAFEIDTRSDIFAKVMESQWDYLQQEGNLFNFAEEAFLSRLSAVGRRFGVEGQSQEDSRTALKGFLRSLYNFRAPSILPVAFERPSWMVDLGDFYGNLGANVAQRENILMDIERNLQETNSFFPTLTNLEVFLNLSEKADLAPEIRAAILRLFASEAQPALDGL